MPHLNTILINTSRDFISAACQRTRYRYTFDPENLAPSVEDSGERYNVAIYPSVKYLLNDAAGPGHSLQSLRDVLRGVLVGVAAKRTKKPEKVVENFLADLERRHLGSFLTGGTADDVERRDAKLRYQLDRLGYRLEKSRRRDPLHPNHAVYDVIHRVSCEINLDAPRDLTRLEKWVEAQLAATRV